MCGDAVFGGMVHLGCTNLDLKGNSLGANDRGVERLITVGLGGGDIVLKPAGHQVKQVVNMAQHVIAVGNILHDDPEGKEIVYFV